MAEPDSRDGAVVDLPVDTAPGEALATRRRRFRAAIADLSQRSTSDDLVRWMLVPGSVAVLLGFVAMVLAWVGAARTAREIEQIPYLISGGLVGLALVVLGGLLLASTFWVAVLHKVHEEAEARARAQVDLLVERLAQREPRPDGRAASTRKVSRRSS